MKRKHKTDKQKKIGRARQWKCVSFVHFRPSVANANVLCDDYKNKKNTKHIKLTEGKEDLLLQINDDCMDIAHVALRPLLSCQSVYVGQTVTHLRYLSKVLIFWISPVQVHTTCKHKHVTHYQMLNVECREIASENDESCDVFLCGGMDRYFKSCKAAIVSKVSMKWNNVKQMWQEIISNQERFEQLNKLSSVAYSMVCLSFCNNTKHYLAVSLGRTIEFVNAEAFSPCGNIEMCDFIKHMTFDATTCCLSVLFEKCGIALVSMHLAIDQTDVDDLSWSPTDVNRVIYRTWSGVDNACHHISLYTHTFESNEQTSNKTHLLNILSSSPDDYVDRPSPFHSLKLRYLICDRNGYVTLFDTPMPDKTTETTSKAQSDPDLVMNKEKKESIEETKEDEPKCIVGVNSCNHLLHFEDKLKVMLTQQQERYYQIIAGDLCAKLLKCNLSHDPTASSRLFFANQSTWFANSDGKCGKDVLLVGCDGSLHIIEIPFFKDDLCNTCQEEKKTILVVH
ncbi:hypothetical protein RFI_14502 [Reticulomyxa filosa]|uniref:Uncharacterized protein n=1 Tax=Reticulomyxa filosa TaxID=46433 RepID=X6N9V0_RETFI|nr:hypothetical protein RFI_14502 [Reticulomyxa filosa]|eukprot:ETO22688.1 hypothetical protein RFI_14502 [Reticulomyxa filosa]